jgi:predicted small lipoprotein YifL
VTKFAGAKPFVTAATVVMAALLVSACGTRGPLKPPSAADAGGEPTKSAESADPGSNSAAPKKAHEPFILDGLLR